MASLAIAGTGYADTMTASYLISYGPAIEIETDMVYISGDNVNLRTYPSTEASVAASLNTNDTVERIHQIEDWSAVKYLDRIYFVHNDYISLTEVEKKVYTPIYSSSYLRRMGVVRHNGKTYTWYSQRVLPGGGLRIPGRHVSNDGYVVDENDYVAIAMNNIPMGAVIEIPFHNGFAKVYDRVGSSEYGANNVIDIYTNF